MAIRACYVLGVILVSGLAGVATVAAPVQDRPGLPTQGKVWVENRGRNQAIPVVIVPQNQADRPEPLPVQVLNVPAVTLAQGGTLHVRSARQPWEYRTLVIPAGQDTAAAVNALGSDGFEAVGIVSADETRAVLLLKRPR